MICTVSWRAVRVIIAVDKVKPDGDGSYETAGNEETLRSV